MFCAKCGKENVDDAVVCIGCGRQIESSSSSKEGPWSTGRMIFYSIFSFFLPLIGVIAGIYGLVREEKRKQGATLLCLAIIGVAMYASFSRDSANQSSKQESATQSIYIGDSFREGEIEAKIVSVETRERVGGEYFVKQVSQGGVYLVVQWEYKNVSNKPISAFHKTSIVLLDPNGNEYKSDLDATSSFATESDLDEKVLSDLNPGISVKGAEVFEVAKDRFSDEWKLKVGGVIISLMSKEQSTPPAPDPAPVSPDPAPTSTTQEPDHKAAPEPVLPAEHAPAATSSEPSFDCAKASTDIERLICSNAELAALDVKLSQAYREKSNTTADKATLKKMQNEWRKSKRDACSDVVCLIDSYKQRIEELK